MADPYQLALTAWVRATKAPWRVHAGDGLAAKLGWARKKFAATRRKLIDQGEIIQTLPQKIHPLCIEGREGGRAQR